MIFYDDILPGIQCEWCHMLSDSTVTDTVFINIQKSCHVTITIIFISNVFFVMTCSSDCVCLSVWSPHLVSCGTLSFYWGNVQTITIKSFSIYYLWNIFQQINVCYYVTRSKEFQTINWIEGELMYLKLFLKF